MSKTIHVNQEVYDALVARRGRRVGVSMNSIVRGLLDMPVEQRRCRNCGNDEPDEVLLAGGYGNPSRPAYFCKKEFHNKCNGRDLAPVEYYADAVKEYEAFVERGCKDAK